VPITSDGAPCAAPQGVGPKGSCAVAYRNQTQRYAVNDTAFLYVNHSTSLPEAPFPWKPGSRHSRSTVNWPPKGLKLSVNFRSPASAAAQHMGTTVTVHYELFDGHPIITKWVTVNAPPKRAEEVAAPGGDGLLPLDQQGPVHISPCGGGLSQIRTFNGQEWLIISTHDEEGNGGGGGGGTALAFGSPIFMQNGTGGGGASENECLSATAGTARHSFNDRSDVVPCQVVTLTLYLPCINLHEPSIYPPFTLYLPSIYQANTADPHQLWSLNSTSKVLQCGVSSGCCLDVNNHQKLNGTVASLGECSSAWHWQMRKPTKTKDGTLAQIESVEAPGLCLTYHAEAPPPPPPPGPGPLPSEAIVVTGMVVETLRLNGPWGATEPRPFDPTYGHGTYYDDSGPTLKTRTISGLLIPCVNTNPAAL